MGSRAHLRRCTLSHKRVLVEYYQCHGQSFDGLNTGSRGFGHLEACERLGHRGGMRQLRW